MLILCIAAGISSLHFSVTTEYPRLSNWYTCTDTDIVYNLPHFVVEPWYIRTLRHCWRTHLRKNCTTMFLFYKCPYEVCTKLSHTRGQFVKGGRVGLEIGIIDRRLPEIWAGPTGYTRWFCQKTGDGDNPIIRSIISARKGSVHWSPQIINHWWHQHRAVLLKDTQSSAEKSRCRYDLSHNCGHGQDTGRCFWLASNGATDHITWSYEAQCSFEAHRNANSWLFLS